MKRSMASLRFDSFMRMEKKKEKFKEEQKNDNNGVCKKENKSTTRLGEKDNNINARKRFW